MKREITLIFIGVALIIIGTFFLLRYQSQNLPSNEVPAESATTVSSWPKFISIPDSQIEAQVGPGGYKDGKWVLDDNFVLYLPTSQKIGDGGNTVLYAHNKSKLFGNLKKTSVGDVVFLYDTKGQKYDYYIYSKEYVKPYEAEKINTYAIDTITLFTCDGWFDEKRLVIKAKIIKKA